jgi:hypothetical protein
MDGFKKVFSIFVYSTGSPQSFISNSFIHQDLIISPRPLMGRKWVNNAINIGGVNR